MSFLVVRTYTNTTYRDVIELCEASDKLRETLGLFELPNYSTSRFFPAAIQLHFTLTEQVFAKLKQPVQDAKRRTN